MGRREWVDFRILRTESAHTKEFFSLLWMFMEKVFRSSAIVGCARMETRLVEFSCETREFLESRKLLSDS